MDGWVANEVKSGGWSITLYITLYTLYIPGYKGNTHLGAPASKSKSKS